ncbi:Mannosylfructose-phosphate synthase [Weeksella virosa]|uniref:glycosyltransferase n=1 Tax=Weeksella virosa TaxID=1014 RepID=UPI000E058DAA|nr:glycosyltransferase [Weeksella virosa]SUP53601.1 Mannosylfructose-phosphate synthase [Weeksella virosa]
MKTVFFILPNLHQGGAEKIVTTICNELDRKQFRSVLLLFQKEGPFLKDLKSDVEIIELKTKRIRFAIFPILQEIYKRKPSIVFSGWGEISAFLSYFIPLFPKVKFVSRETNVVSKHVVRKEILFFYKFYHRFDAIIAQSEDMRQDLIENFHLAKEKIVKIHNPVDFELLDQKQNQPIELPFSSDHKNVIAIGNLTARKGFDLLLNVFAELKNTPIHLYVLGDGVDKEKLEHQRQALGLENVHFLGHVENPYPYLAAADLFILSSRYEGFPNVLLEAGACGTYALCNDCLGGINEIIQPKRNGEILAIENTKAFAERIVHILEDKHDASSIRDSIKSRFDKKFIIHQYEEILNKL